MRKFFNDDHVYVKVILQACLKTATVQQLLEAHDRLGHANPGFTLKWLPRVDGHFFPSDIPDLLREAPPLPGLVGHTKDEYVSFCEFCPLPTLVSCLCN